MSFQNQHGVQSFDTPGDGSSQMQSMEGGGTPSGPAIFNNNMPNPKMEEIKRMLNEDKDSHKLDAMKRLIAMISKGRNVSALFPQVVKNVICENVEVKNLVYMYLIHYAEFEQDAALLSINHFQKDLENPNQLIRAQALRVMSAFRLPVIVRILILSVQKCVTDNSPYVRKTAAHAIPKIFSLDHTVKEELIDCIETLLGDNTTLVLGSAVAAFSEICPKRYDLIHPHFRKFCNMLADMDEWGQIYVVNMLTRYCRTQFENPNEEEQTPGAPKRVRKKASFYSDEEDDEEEDVVEDIYSAGELDSDHRLLIRAANPLLQSRNSGVVMAVAALYFYCAPKPEAQKVGKAMVRLCRSTYEVQYVVLSNISAMADSRPDMFSAYITEFFVYDSDPSFVRGKKLEIVTKIVSASTINRAMREFTHYVHKEDKQFVAATIQAIGRCATRLPEVQESCLHGLMALLSNRSEVVVAEAVVVIKKLLQLGGDEDYVISHLAKLLDSISIANARASIVWVVGEYCARIPLLAPDIFRKLAKSFRKEHVSVKLQIINLGAKLLLKKPDDTINLIFQYVCGLCKYDTNYDVRDRARSFRTILVGTNTPTLRQHALKLFCSSKPAPSEAGVDDPNHFALNSLSHMLNHTAFGYEAIPEWAKEMPDPSTRNQVARKQRRDYLGMGSSTSGSSYTPGTYSTARDGDDGDGDFYSSDGSGFYSDEYDSEYDSEEDTPPRKKAQKKQKKESFYSDESEEESEEEYESEEDEGSNDFFSAPAQPAAASDFFGSSAPAADPFATASSSDPFASTPAAADPFASSAPAADPFASTAAADPFSTPAADPFASAGTKSLDNDLLNMSLGSSSSSLLSVEPSRDRKVLLKDVLGNGLEVQYLFQRRQSLYGADYSAIQIWFNNKTSQVLQGVKVVGSDVSGGADVKGSDDVSQIVPGASVEAQLNVKFASYTTPLEFEVIHSTGRFKAKMTPPAGELVSARNMSTDEFETLQRRLGGMQEASSKFTAAQGQDFAQTVVDSVNVAVITNDAGAGRFTFAGKTVIENDDLLISVNVDNETQAAVIRVNCGNAIFANTLLSALKPSLAN